MEHFTHCSILQQSLSLSVVLSLSLSDYLKLGPVAVRYPTELSLLSKEFCRRPYGIKLRGVFFCSTARDVLATGKCETILERPVQSRPVRAGLYHFQDIFKLLKLHMVESLRALCQCLFCIMSLWGKLLQKIAARQAYNASRCDAL